MNIKICALNVKRLFIRERAKSSVNIVFTYLTMIVTIVSQILSRC